MTENRKRATGKEVDESEGQVTHTKETSAVKAEDYGLGSDKKKKKDQDQNRAAIR